MKLFDEIPSTKRGLENYIDLMEKSIVPVSKQFHRMDDLLKEAKIRFERIKSSKMSEASV